MAKAIWEGTILAESDACIQLEGNHYFPPESIRREFFEPSLATTTCAWKGTARYYDLVVNGKMNVGAAWYYQEPAEAADQIRGYVGFWKGVRVVP